MDKQKIIFIVDDKETNLSVAKDALKDQYRVLNALSAARMFNLLEKITPDLILLDIEMPDMNGYEAIKRLKADERFASIPVIFLTAKIDEKSEQTGFDLGAADYMSKPFSAPLLLKRIEHQLLIAQQTKELIAAVNKAENASLAKGNFLSNMSHEIRTPINAILGMTQIAMKSDDMQKIKYCLEMIDNSSSHLLRLINDILDMSKIEAGMLQLEKAPFNLENMLTKICNLITEKIIVKNIQLNVEISPDIRTKYVGDELRLSQVIANLLSNAVKFTPGGGTIDLIVKGETKEKYTDLHFTVRDTGIGMSDDQILTLFKAFVQADSSTSRKFGGTGLGLAISKSIVEKMGGRIYVQSKSGEGSSFFVEIRLDHEESQNDTGVTLNQTFDIPDFSSITLLLAEDVEINREIVLSLLEDTKITIDTAENGQIAVDKFKQNPGKYNIIIMDVNMPEMDGREATRIIRSLDMEWAKNIPIIALTANVFKEDIDTCHDAGMTDHLSKPLEIDTVIKKIKHYCSL